MRGYTRNHRRLATVRLAPRVCSCVLQMGINGERRLKEGAKQYYFFLTCECRPGSTRMRRENTALPPCTYSKAPEQRHGLLVWQRNTLAPIRSLGV